MQPYISIYFLLIILLIMRRNRKAAIAVTKTFIKRRKTEESKEMTELAKRFIGKECIISAFDSNHAFTGIVKEVSDNAVLIEKNGALEAININFVIRIREYPKNKNGKKKSVVLEY